MTTQMADLEDLEPVETPVLVQEKEIIPTLWSRISAETQRQLAQQLAQMIRKIREGSSQEKSRDERV
jgi:hypothetical protein